MLMNRLSMIKNKFPNIISEGIAIVSNNELPVQDCACQLKKWSIYSESK
jgi:hypothetical protein